MGLFENLYNNIRDEIHYQNAGNFIGEAMTNHDINKRLKSNPVNRRQEKKESAYDIERKAQDINGDANYILCKAEDRIDKSRKRIIEKISHLREREIFVLSSIDKEYEGNENDIMSMDQEFITAIKRPAFYGEYDGHPFTIKGIFTTSYEDAEIEAEKAMMIAKANKAQAKAVAASVDAMLSHFDSIEELINTTVANSNYIINERHRVSLEKLKILME